MESSLSADGSPSVSQFDNRFGVLAHARVAGASRRHLLRDFVGAVSMGLLAMTGAGPAQARRHGAGSASRRKDETVEFVLAPDGTRIAYHRGGDGLPLVVVHGTADDHTLWAPLLPGLEERFTVYALDRRGRGGSGATDAATYAIEREFEDVAAVVDAVGGPVHLLGHSYGALCALEAALRTGKLRTLVLYEPPIPIPPGSTITPPGTLATMEALLAAGDREGVLLTFAREIARLPEEAIAALGAMPEWQAGVDAAPTIVDEVRALEDYVFDPDRFRNLITPTLLLLGSESPPFLQAATGAVAAALPHNRQAVLPGQGHRAMDTDPDRLLSEVVQFLDEERAAVVAGTGGTAAG